MKFNLNNFNEILTRKYKFGILLIALLIIICYIGWKIIADKFSSFYFLSFIVLTLFLISKFELCNLLVIYLVLLPFNYWVTIDTLNLNLNELLILTLFSIWLFSNILSNGKIKYRNNPFNKWILAYVVSSFILLFNSPLDDKSTYKAITRTMEFGMLFFVLANKLPNNSYEKYLKKLLDLLLLSMAIVCCIGIIEYIIYTRNYPESFINFHQTMISLGIYPPRPLKNIINLSLEGKTIGSTFGSKSALSIYLSIILPLVFIKILFTKNLYKKIILVFMFTIGLINLFLTGSRTGLIAFLFGIVIILYKLGTKKLFSIGISVILGILVFSYFLPQDFRDRIAFRTHQSSFMGRKVYLIRSIEIIRKNFFIGSGIDSIGAEEGQSKPHNLFISEFQTKGIFGFLIISGLMFLALKVSYENLKLLSHNKNLGVFTLWIFVLTIIYFIISFATEPFYENQTSVLFIFAIAISSIFSKSKMNYEEK